MAACGGYGEAALVLHRDRLLQESRCETVSSSLAQVFDEFGRGIILRGTPVSIDKRTATRT